MSTPVLGIDLGTTNSVVAIADGSKPRVLKDSDSQALVPSVVSFHPAGDILVGRRARERRLLDAKNTVYSIKRLIGRPFDSDPVRRARERFPFKLLKGPTGGVLVACRGDTYTLSEISAFVLRRVRTQAEEALGRECTRAVITVPANFNELQRSATKAAGRVAGLEVLRILNEPTSAALAYGQRGNRRERIAVYDLGGGTFDLTVLELAGSVFEVLATAGDTYLGGDDIDEMVADRMAEAFLEHHRYDPREDEQAYERLRAAAEWAKCQLSSEKNVQLRIEELAYGEGGASLDLNFALEREALEKMVQPLLARSFDVCEEAFKLSGLRPSQLDRIILVGGATRMPLVRCMVQEYFGQEPLAKIDPDLVVAIGAAIQGRALTQSPARHARPIGKVALKQVAPASVGPKVPTDTLIGVSPASLDDDAEITAVRGAPVRIDALADPSEPPDQSSQPAPAIPPPVPPSQRARADVDPTQPTRTQSFDDSSSPEVHLDPDETPLRSVLPALPSPESPSAKRTLEGIPAIVPSHRAASARPTPTKADAGPPLLLDVTPLSLGVETVGGYCEPIIRRNAAIPVEQTRIFSTAQDDQEVVRVAICQGESRRIGENQALGEIELSGLRPALRGSVRIGVTFMIDVNGTLDVRAKDLATGREQAIQINLIGGFGEAAVQQMQQRHAELASRQR